MTEGFYTDDQATFGDRLTAAREAAGLSATDFARRLGVAGRTVTAWEHDQAEPRSNRMQMIAGLLNVSLRWLMTGEGPGLTPPAGVFPVGAIEGGDEPLPNDQAVALAAMQAEVRALRGLLSQAEDRTRRLDRRIAAALGEA